MQNLTPRRRPPTPSEIAQALELALLTGKNLRERRAASAAAIMAEHLARQGYVVLRLADGWPALSF